MPSEVVLDAILPRVTLATGKRSSGYLAVPVWSTARAGGAMIWRTSRGANRNRWEGLSGKARTKTGIGKSDLPGLQGGPRKRDFVFMTKCARLGSIPTPVNAVAGRPVASLASRRATGEVKRRHARERAVRIQLRNLSRCGCRRR